jgi:FAD/FMN-containing dehydrogenase
MDGGVVMAARTEIRIPAAALSGFERNFEGEIITPAHAAYHDARKVWNGMIDRRPLLIARPRRPADVATVIRLAREHDVAFAIRGGGHNVAGSGVCDAGVVCDLSALRAVEVDAVTRTARAQGGATWLDFDRATHAIGMATTGGMVSTTGIGGLTLGGGLGWLMRAHGLACDQVLSVDLVTADGKTVTCHAANNPDLYWAVRGGGGNFGVATTITYSLHPVDEVLGGLLIYPLDRAGEVLRHYDQYCRDTPDHVTTAAAFATAPDIAAFPEPLRGRPICMIALCAIGVSGAVQAAIAPLRRFGPPTLDLVAPTTYPALQSSLDAGSPPHARNYWKSGYMSALSGDVIDELVDNFSRAASPMSQVLIHQIGGAVARVDEQATAFPNRTSPYLINVVGMWQRPDDDAANIEWTRSFWRAIEHATSGKYVNYVGDDESERIESIYPLPTLRRLMAAKAKWDPDNFFRANHNIRPG